MDVMYLLNIRWKDLSGAPVEKFARRESSAGAPDRSRLYHRFLYHRLLRRYDVMEISGPDELEYAIHLARTVSKLSPLIGNTLEYRLVSLLNKQAGTTLGK